jgi:hypothetical protein
MNILSKPKLKIFVEQATHFLRWELPHLEKHFTLVDEAGEDTILYAFGPDVLSKAASIPALRRVIMLFPGFGLNPYHNLEYRQTALKVINESYDLAFVNPGPLAVAYQSSDKMSICPFTIDAHLIHCLKYRKKINSLLHVSAPTPQKDWERSQEIMQRTGLCYEVYPPRKEKEHTIDFNTRLKSKINRVLNKLNIPFQLKISTLANMGYRNHQKVIQKYHAYDAFVHVAAEVVHDLYIDGKYTACTLEAGLTGAIVFWHDTLQLGNDFETFFDLPLDPQEAAAQILLIKNNLDVEKHSKRTREEILDKNDASKSLGYRAQKIKELI